MSDLAELVTDLAQIRARIETRAAELMRSGISAAAIGRVLGVSRQAIQKRYAPAYQQRVSNIRSLVVDERGRVAMWMPLTERG